MLAATSPWSAPSSAVPTNWRRHPRSNGVSAVSPRVTNKRRPERLPRIPIPSTVPYVPGENVRNWSWEWRELAIFPYDKNHAVRKYELTSPEIRWLRKFRHKLEGRIYFGQTQTERGLVWYEYGIVVWQNCDTPNKLIFADLSTHGHFVRVADLAAFNQHTPVLALPSSSPEIDLHLVAALMNSSTALFWLKQVSYNRGAGEDEHRDRFEFMGGKVQEVPVPAPVAISLKGKPTSLGQTLAKLARACWSAGQNIPQLNFRRLFALSSEAYGAWNQGLPHFQVSKDEAFADTETAQQARTKLTTNRDSVRNSMIALQEEMDWLIYAAYGLLPAGHPAVREQFETIPLTRNERPFVLWEKAGGDYNHAIALIPSAWSAERRTLWEARLAAIRDNEHRRFGLRRFRAERTPTPVELSSTRITVVDVSVSLPSAMGSGVPGRYLRQVGAHRVPRPPAIRKRVHSLWGWQHR